MSRRFDLAPPETRAEVAWQIVCHLRTILILAEQWLCSLRETVSSSATRSGRQNAELGASSDHAPRRDSLRGTHHDSSRSKPTAAQRVGRGNSFKRNTTSKRDWDAPVEDLPILSARKLISSIRRRSVFYSMLDIVSAATTIEGATGPASIPIGCVECKSR